MITAGQLLYDIDFQTQVKFYYYSEKLVKRIEISQEAASDQNVRYMYVEDGIICIEVEDAGVLA